MNQIHKLLRSVGSPDPAEKTKIVPWLLVQQNFRAARKAVLGARGIGPKAWASYLASIGMYEEMTGYTVVSAQWKIQQMGPRGWEDVSTDAGGIPLSTTHFTDHGEALNEAARFPGSRVVPSGTPSVVPFISTAPTHAHNKAHA